MLFEQIAANKRKTVYIIVAFILVLLGAGAAMGIHIWNDVVPGLIIAVNVELIYSLIMLTKASAIVMGLNGAEEITDKSEAPLLFDTVESIAIAAGIPMPRLYIIDDMAPNAFATGTSPENGAIAITTGLLEELDLYEVEAVIAHEIAHIRNYDIRLNTISIALVSAVSFICNVSRNVRPETPNDKVDFERSASMKLLIILTTSVFLLIAPVISVLLHFALSRNREYLADATAVELTRNPEGLIIALRKIALAPYHIDHIDTFSKSIWFSSPLAEDVEEAEEAGWFDTHPPISARIARVKAM